MVEYPADWNAKEFGDLGKIVGGGTPSTQVSSYWDGSINWFTPGEILETEKYSTNSKRTITEAGLNNSPAKLLPVGAVLLTTRASIGLTSLLAVPAATNQGFQSVVVNEDNDREYVYYLIGVLKSEMQSRASGSTFLEISPKQLKTIPVVVPPLPEQKRIAAVLSNADKLIANVEKRIAKKRAIKQGAMQELLRKVQGESGSLGYFETRGYLKLYRGKVISKLDVLGNPGIFPIYSSSVTNEGLMGKYGLHMFDEELISWSIDGGGNFFYRPKHKFSVTNVCGYMRVDTNKIDYRFFSYELQHLHSFKQFDYQTKAHPSVIRKEYIVVVPELAEQRAIAKVLSGMDAEIANLERKLEKLKLMKQGMMQDLLTGKVRLK